MAIAGRIEYVDISVDNGYYACIPGRCRACGSTFAEGGSGILVTRYEPTRVVMHHSGDGEFKEPDAARRDCDQAMPKFVVRIECGSCGMRIADGGVHVEE